MLKEDQRDTDTRGDPDTAGGPGCMDQINSIEVSQKGGRLQNLDRIGSDRIDKTRPDRTGLTKPGSDCVRLTKPGPDPKKIGSP